MKIKYMQKLNKHILDDMIEPVKYHRDEDCNIIHNIYRVNKYIENN